METMQLLDSGSGSLGGSTLGAFGGALVGSWFADGWGNRKGDTPSASIEPMLMDAVHANGSAIGSNTIANLQGFSGLNTTVLQGFAQHQNSVNQGFAGLNDVVNNSGYQIQNTLTQGFSGLGTAISQAGYQNQLATLGLSKDISDCCCRTNSTILAEGSATRQLIQNNLITQLQTELCDQKANNIALKQEVALQASQQAQTAALIAALGK